MSTPLLSFGDVVLIRLHKNVNDKSRCNVDNILTSCQRVDEQMSSYITGAFRKRGIVRREGGGKGGGPGGGGGDE